jgi:hypothetical protein
MTDLLQRRLFLRTLAVGGGYLALSSLGLGTGLRTALAAPPCDTGNWGALVGNVGGWTCESHAGFKVLEIYCYAGASMWESCWLPGNGSGPTFTDYDMGMLQLSGLDWNANTTDFPCEAPAIPPSWDDAQLFASQSGGGNIYWGAAARPLFQRSDILPRCRMVTHYHELAPHEAAIPYMLAGLELGNPRRAGTGAAVQRRARVVTPEQLLPVSYVLHDGASLAAPAAVATGLHPGFARPLEIRIQNNDAFVQSLARNGIGSESDALLSALRHEYRDRLRFRGAGDPVRSAGFDGYWVAAELLEDAPAMQSLFAGGILVRDNAVATCPEHPAASSTNSPGIKTMLHAAASLLGSGPARYVCCIDRGITGSYDTHGNGTQQHLLRTNANLYNLFHHLADIIRDPVQNPSGPIDLDETLVVINTDFNRTPHVNGNSGRDHWPLGSLSFFIGGPLAAGPSIRGRIDAAGYTEVDYRYSATDLRGAILLAAGIDPFAEGNFRVSDFSATLLDGIGTEAQIRDRLKVEVLGV